MPQGQDAAQVRRNPCMIGTRGKKSQNERRNMAEKEDMLRVGVYSNTHGIRGEIKVFPTTDDATRFKKLKKVFLDTREGLKEFTIIQVKFFKQMVILKFKEISNINEIEPYKGCDLLIERKDAVPLEENEYFICDIIGAEVYTEDGELFGSLKDVMTTGANDVYVVTTTEKKEVLLPVIPDCVKEIDTEHKKVVVHIMKGLLD